MAGLAQPLDEKFPIVGPDGRPTLYFIKWAQQRQIDISGGITLSDLIDYLAAHALQEGPGIQITPSGDLNQSPIISADVQEILDQLSATRGTIIYRGLLGWTVLLPGTAGYFLKTNGAGADPVWAAGGGGGGLTALGTPIFATLSAPSVNFYLMRMLLVDADFTIAKIAFEMSAAVPTAKLQVFVYACSAAGVPGALLGSSIQQTGVVAGYNEIVLTASVAVTKGSLIWVGASGITAALTNLWHLSTGLAGFAGNGASTVPANPAPAITQINNPVYGFWAVA